MVYKNLQFPKNKNRPFFFTNFVSTVDGKVQVVSDPYSYWPIGSKVDFQTLIELRAHADVLIHGKNTALWFDHVSRLKEKEFKKLREKFGKNKDIVYMVLSNNPDIKLINQIKDENSYLITSEKSKIQHKGITILKMGENNIDLKKLSSFLFKNGYKNILVEGGSNLLTSFLKTDLIDEIFLTIAPKIFGNQNNSVLTMAEGFLFPPKDIKKLKLISLKTINDEVYLRYEVIHP